METIIECENIKRTFISRIMGVKRRETVALKDLNFTVPRGKVFGLLGPNGSGKTTTIRILSTLLIPTSGQARVFGCDVVRDAARIRKRIGLILGGERGLYGRLTGAENLRYFAALNHLSHETARHRIKEAIETVGLTEAGNRKVEQYSRGMVQRLHIARGILTDPELIFMDEPTIGLDPQGAYELRQLVPEIIRRGKTILLTTHYMSEADQLCDRIAIIDRGRIVVTGTPSEIKRKFSRISILEIVIRENFPDAVSRLDSVEGIVNIASSSEGLLQKLTIQLPPGLEIKEQAVELLGRENVESVVMREPTLEEAYLSIIK
jgi:ABC-2 type transport system ATP-binding protein